MSIAKVAAARVTIHISYIQSFIVVWLIVPKLQKQNIPMTQTAHYFCCGLYIRPSDRRAGPVCRRFLACDSPGDHSCLDQYSTDGVLQFEPDVWPADE